ncbi:MAG: Gfo/Idh/MocA family oxidoreductase [Oscillospiraceae bacterium]|nr:Gfo/Idh/MocA family oxidoreductase [Oscillospiraceae bacterium]
MKKLAVIGCGGIGGYHLEHFMQFKDLDFELAGFCDIIPERAEGFAKLAKKGRAYSDFRKMYDEVNPDFVFIGIPPYKHGEIEFETIERGIHMFVEKPVTLDIDMAIEISAQINAKNLIAASGFQCRYDNINEPVLDYIKNNQIVIMQASRVGGVPEVDWWRKKDLSGGQLAEQTVHQMDLIRYLLGEIDTVYSVPTRGFIKDEEWPGYDTDDASTTVFKFKSGISGTMTTGCHSLNGASWDSKMTFGSRSSRLDYILCSHALIYGLEEQDKAEDISGVVKGDGMQLRNENEVGIRYNTSVDFGKICDRTFIEAVISGEDSMIQKIKSPYCDAVKTLAFVLACNESMATGKPVRVKI